MRLPSGTRDVLGHLAALEIDQLQAAAAEIADEAVGIDMKLDTMPAAASSASSRPVQHLNPAAKTSLGLRDEPLAVRGAAHRFGGEGEDPLDPDLLAQFLEAPQRIQRPLDRLLVEAAVGRALAAEPAQQLFIDHWRRAAQLVLIDDEADRNWNRCRRWRLDWLPG